MTDADTLRRLALALDGTVEAPHMERTAFRVHRIYATLAADGLSANLKFTPDEQQYYGLLYPEAFSPVPGGWGRMGYTAVVLDKLSDAQLRGALVTAWEHARAKKR
jgi:hypothetical protein